MADELNIFTIPKVLEERKEQQETKEGVWVTAASSQWVVKATGGGLSWKDTVEVPENIYRFLYGETKLVPGEVMPTGIISGESRMDKLLETLSDKSKIIDSLRHDIEKSDAEFSKTLNRVLFAFIFIFLIMVYLFLIK